MSDASREQILDHVTSIVHRTGISHQQPNLDEITAQFPEIARNDALSSDVASIVKMQAWLARDNDTSAAFDLVSADSDDGDESPQRMTLGKTWGDFILLDELGAGGFGQVFKAWQMSQERCVAVKRLHASLLSDESAVRRFREEPRHLLKLHHDRIIKVLDVGEVDGLPFFTMELINGTNLSVLSRSQALGTERICTIVMQVAEALHFAHTHGILHRDIKPSNVMLTHELVPKVGDFGLAKDLSSDHGITKTDAILGTCNYLAPEVAAGTPRSDAASDVYGLGAMLYELLTGTPPFRGETHAQTLAMVQTSEVVPPRRVNPNVDAGLEAICLKCLEKDPQQRYSTAAEIADECQRLLKGRRQRAPRHTWLRRTWRAARRRPGLSAFVIATFVAAIAFAGTYFAYLESERQRNFEQRQAARTSQQYELDLSVADARTAMQSGGWGRALELLNNAIAKEQLSRHDWRMDRAACLMALSRPQDALAQLTALADDPTCPDKFRPRLELWRGHLMLDAQGPEAITKIKKALQSKQLSLADQQFAEGLLALSFPEAIEHFGAALEVDPGHLGARESLVSSLLLMSRWDEAYDALRFGRSIYPEHLTFPLAEVIVLTAKGEDELSNQVVQQLTEQLSKDEIETLRILQDVFGTVREVEVSRLLNATPQEALSLMWKLIKPLGKALTRTMPKTNSRLKLAWPPLIAESLGELNGSQLGVTRMLLNPGAHLDTLQEAGRIMPQGYLYYMIGYVQTQRAEWPEAIKNLEKAATLPSIFQTRRHAKYLLSQSIKQLSFATKDEDEQREIYARAADLVVELLDDSPSSFSDVEFGFMADTLSAASRFDALRELAKIWCETHPRSHTAFQYLALAELNLGMPFVARRSLNQARELGTEQVILERIGGWIETAIDDGLNEFDRAQSEQREE